MRRWRIPENNIVSLQCGICPFPCYYDSRVQSLKMTSFPTIMLYKYPYVAIFPPFDCSQSNVQSTHHINNVNNY